MRKTIAGVIAGCARWRSPATRWPRKSSPSGGSRASTSPRTTRSSRPSRSFEAKHPKIKIELSQYPIQDMIPKTVSALDSGSPPDVAYADVYDFQVTAKWAFDGKLEGHQQRDRPDPGSLRAQHGRDRVPLQRQETRRAPYFAFPIKQQTMHIEYWGDMLADAGFKDADIPTTWKEYWSFWCDKVQPASRQKTGPAHLRHRNADGRRFEPTRFYSFPDLHGTRTTSSSSTTAASCWSTTRTCGRGLIGAPHRLHRAVHEGLLAAVVDELEGSGQQRRVPQPHHG